MLWKQLRDGPDFRMTVCEKRIGEPESELYSCRNPSDLNIVTVSEHIEIQNLYALFFSETALPNRRLIKTPVKILRFQHIDDDMGILLPHQFNDLRCFVGRHHRMQQVHFLMAVTTHRLHTGDPVAVFLHIRLHHLFRMHGSDLQGHPLIAVMKGRDGSCRNKLKQNGIPGVDQIGRAHV